MSHVVTLRLSDEDYCKLKQAVKRTKLPQSEFIRNALVNRNARLLKKWFRRIMLKWFSEKWLTKSKSLGFES